MLAFACAAKSSQPAIRPQPNDHFRVVLAKTCDRFAATTHHAEENLNTMYSIPKQIRMMRFQRRWTKRIGSKYFSYRIVIPYILYSFHISQRGGRKKRHIFFHGSFVNGDYICK